MTNKLTNHELTTLSKLESIAMRIETIQSTLKKKQTEQFRIHMIELRRAVIELNRYTFLNTSIDHKRFASAFKDAALYTSSRVTANIKDDAVEMEGYFDYDKLSKNLLW